MGAISNKNLGPFMDLYGSLPYVSIISDLLHQEIATDV